MKRTGRRRSRGRLCAGGVGLMILLGACGGEPNRSFYSLPPDPETLVLYDLTDPPTLDPARSWGVFDGRVIGLIFPNLVKFDREARLIPDAAREWRIADDGLTYTFWIRDEARFANGRAITAEDVVYSFSRVLDPATASNSRWVLERIAAMRAVEAKAVELQLKEPFAPFLDLLAMPAASIVPREEVEKCEREGIPFGERPVGGGPWRLVEWQHDQYLRLERDEGYWGEKPVMAHLLYRIITNPFTAMAEFETGHVAVIEPLPAEEILRMKTHPQWGRYVELAPLLTLDMVVLNTERLELRRAETRRALAQTLDYPLLLEAVREGAGISANGPIPQGLKGHLEDGASPAYDPQGAVAALREAGLTERPLRFLLSSSEGFIRKLGEIIQAEWKKLGITVELLQPEWVTYRKMLVEGEFDLAFRNWFADYPDGDSFLFPLFHSSQIGSSNMSRFRNEEIDRLIEASQQERDEERRTRLLEETSRRIRQESPAIFLWYRAEYHVTQPWLEGYSVPLLFNGTRYLRERIRLPAP